jgi:uncharacterized protein (TIGR02246 family)
MRTVAPVQDTETRLRRLEDLEEIRALRIEYGQRLDRKDFAGLAALFTPDGELRAPLGTAKGRDAIAQTVGGRLDTIPAGYHYYSNTAISLDGDRATMRVMFAYLQPDAEEWPKTWLIGHYDDVLRREQGRWLFERVTITIDVGFPPYARKLDARSA